MMEFSRKMKFTHSLMKLGLCYLETCDSLESSSCSRDSASYGTVTDDVTGTEKAYKLFGFSAKFKSHVLSIMLDLTSRTQFPRQVQNQ